MTINKRPGGIHSLKTKVLNDFKTIVLHQLPCKKESDTIQTYINTNVADRNLSFHFILFPGEIIYNLVPVDKATNSIISSSEYSKKATKFFGKDVCKSRKDIMKAGVDTDNVNNHTISIAIVNDIEGEYGISDKYKVKITNMIGAILNDKTYFNKPFKDFENIFTINEIRTSNPVAKNMYLADPKVRLSLKQSLLQYDLKQKKIKYEEEKVK